MRTPYRSVTSERFDAVLRARLPEAGILCGEVALHQIEGISDGFVPGIIDRHRGEVDEMVAVDSERAIAEMRRLAREFGLFVGPSSGAHLIAARELRERYPDAENVVTFFCDEGEKYLAEYYLG